LFLIRLVGRKMEST